MVQKKKSPLQEVRQNLRHAAEKSGMTLEEIGLRMGFSKGGARQAVSRLLNQEADYDPRLSTLLAFAAAVNRSLNELIPS
jgi:transcriptional regulator with XRE-family HTH domain